MSFYLYLLILVSMNASSQSTDTIVQSDGPHYQHSDFVFENQQWSRYNVSKHVFYWLYTREQSGGVLLDKNDPNAIEKSSFDVKNPIKIPVHGWHGTTHEKEGLCSSLVRSYLDIGRFNVVCVDWKQYSTDVTYATAKLKAKYIGYDIAKMVLRLTKNFSEGVEGVHLIGHSLGAHICGFAGKKLNNGLPRITGLDPAKPLYAKSGPDDRISDTDAVLVDIIHTGTKRLGLCQPLGQIDFYPNGGEAQPNCGKSDKKSGSCSHCKSYHFYAHSIWAKEDYPSLECPSWEDYKKGNCEGMPETYMGEFVNSKLNGTFFLYAYKEDIP
ncbi:lipase member H-B-like [Adelges cooleyi]|uniref:lipase member H-B-like n=1 Tax=Adelges cooleyi TaxID=133065 RepID=UPI00218078AC|nr:lipase member H-B-like [Adelges cooleyi]